MKVLLISEEAFEKEFKSLLQILQIDNLESARKDEQPKVVNYDLHRKFVYELHQFKDALIKSRL